MTQERHSVAIVRTNEQFNAVCLLWDSWEVYKYAVWEECRVLKCQTDVTCGALKCQLARQRPKSPTANTLNQNLTAVNTTVGPVVP